MRQTNRCPKCGHGEVLHVPEVVDSNSDRMALAKDGGLFFPYALIGPFEAFVCRRCGYAELYVQNPGSISVDQIMGARVLTAPSGTPYR